MRKHQILTPLLIPKHFGVWPKESFVSLAEDLISELHYADARLVGDLNYTETDRIQYTELSFQFRIDGGVVKIDDEFIKYEGLEKERIFDELGNETGVKYYIKGLTRGYLDSKPRYHYDKILFNCKLLDDVNAGETNISFYNLEGVPPQKGGFYIDNEYIKYTHFKRYEDGLTFYNCNRGAGGTLPKAHKKDSLIVESEGAIIEDVPIIKYDKYLFSCELVSDITKDSDRIEFRKLTAGEFDEDFTGEILIDGEYIRFESVEFPANGESTRGTFKSLTETVKTDTYYGTETENVLKPMLRGIKGTKRIPHNFQTFTASIYPSSGLGTTDIDVIVSDYKGGKVKPTGQFYISKTFLDDDGQEYTEEECIIYDGFDVDRTTGVYTFHNCERGADGTINNSYDVGTQIYGVREIKEHREVQFKKNGTLKIGQEYVSYWNVDDEYFYITKRGLSNGVLPTVHQTGEYIVEFYDANVNHTIKDYVSIFTEHLDYAVEVPAANFSTLSDVDGVPEEYLTTLVKTFGENLDDYGWMEMDARVFAKELTAIYQTKGLEFSMQMWKKLIDPTSNTSEIDLWTFNYWNFFSLILLVLLLYIPINIRNWTLMNFYLPQISEHVYLELVDTMESSIHLYGYPITDFHLLIREWYYLNKYDDEKSADVGFKFDDKIAPKAEISNAPVEEQPIVLVHNDGTEYSLNDTYCSDCHLPFYKSEDELAGAGAKALLVETIRDDNTEITIDGKIQMPLEWQDNQLYPIGTTIVPTTLDGNQYVCIVPGISGSSEPFWNDTPGNETIDGAARWRCQAGEYVTFYDPDDYMGRWDSPYGRPLGFAKIENEIFNYEEIVFNEVDNTYTLKGCRRGVNRTTPMEHLLEPFKNNPELLYNRPIIQPTEYKLPENYVLQGEIYRLMLDHDPQNFNFDVGDKLILKSNYDEGTLPRDKFEGTWTITNIFLKYYYTQDVWVYGVDFDFTGIVGDVPLIDFNDYAKVDSIYDDYISFDSITTEYDINGNPVENPASSTTWQDYPNVLVSIYDTYIERDVEVEHHLYSQYQWLLWRLLNEVNGVRGSLENIYAPITQKTILRTDLGFVSDMGTGGIYDTGWLPNESYWDYYKPLSQQGPLQSDTWFIYNNGVVEINPELEDMDYLIYDDLSSGIIWPTPHFKWITDLVPPTNSDISIRESIDLLAYKIKEYKPKHTVMESMLNYNLGIVTFDDEVTVSIETPPATYIKSYIWFKIIPLSADFGSWETGMWVPFESDYDGNLLPNFSMITGDELDPTTGMYWSFYDPDPATGMIHSDIFYLYYSNGEVRVDIITNPGEEDITIIPTMDVDFATEVNPNEMDVGSVDQSDFNETLDSLVSDDIVDWNAFFSAGYDKTYNPNPFPVGIGAGAYPDFCWPDEFRDGGDSDGDFDCTIIEGGDAPTTPTGIIDGGDSDDF